MWTHYGVFFFDLNHFIFYFRMLSSPVLYFTFVSLPSFFSFFPRELDGASRLV